MEPLTAGVIATLIATKAFEKTGEKVTENVWNQVSKFLVSLKRKDPQAVAAIEKVAQSPELAEEQPESFSAEVLINRVEAAIQADSEVRQTAEAVKAAMVTQNSVVQNSQLAEKVGILVQGGYASINIDTFNF